MIKAKIHSQNYMKTKLTYTQIIVIICCVFMVFAGISILINGNFLMAALPFTLAFFFFVKDVIKTEKKYLIYGAFSLLMVFFLYQLSVAIMVSNGF